MRALSQSLQERVAESGTAAELLKILIACTINLLAVSTVFMTQSIFSELATSFSIDVTQARFSFSIISLSYAAAFFFLGPAADKFNLPKIAVTGLVLLAMTVIGASYTPNFGLFILAMALMGICAALIPASMFPHVARISPRNKIGVYVGLIVASGTLGVIFGRVFMGILTEAVGWQISFRIVSAVLLFLSAVTQLLLVEKKIRRPETTHAYPSCIKMQCASCSNQKYYRYCWLDSPSILDFSVWLPS